MNTAANLCHANQVKQISRRWLGPANEKKTCAADNSNTIQCRFHSRPARWTASNSTYAFLTTPRDTNCDKAGLSKRSRREALPKKGPGTRWTRAEAKVFRPVPNRPNLNSYYWHLFPVFVLV